MKTEKNARIAAVDALLQVEENEGYSNIVIDKTLRNSELAPRDASLATTIFYGVLEKRITLDFYLSRCLDNPQKKLDAKIEAILRAALYQIIFLDRIPASAAINEAVASAKLLGKTQLSGFVNAVLRMFLRIREEIKLPKENTHEGLSVKYSIPTELTGLWEKAYGKENMLKLLDSFSMPVETYIRVNNIKTDIKKLAKALEAENASLVPLDYPPNAAVLNCRGNITELSAFKDGLFHVQDISSQILCDIISPKGGAIIDACSAPGGKAFTLAEIMNDAGKILAFDLYKGRVNLIRQGASRLGLKSIEAGINDALKGFDGIEKADIVLCDVPCSGYGVIRRKPEIRYKPLSSVREINEIQLQILRKALETVKENGVIIYSTCTLNPRENSLVAERFLAENACIAPMSLRLHPSIGRAIDEPDNMLTLFPFSGGSDGFFMAVFQKRGRK